MHVAVRRWHTSIILCRCVCAGKAGVIRRYAKPPGQQAVSLGNSSQGRQPARALLEDEQIQPRPSAPYADACDDIRKISELGSSRTLVSESEKRAGA